MRAALILLASSAVGFPAAERTAEGKAVSAVVAMDPWIRAYDHEEHGVANVPTLAAITPSMMYPPNERNVADVLRAASKRDFTMLLVFTEKAKQCHGVGMVKLPGGPTARFKVSSVVMPEAIRGHGRPTSHRPELILNNFSTRLGHRVGRMLGCLVPHDPQFRGRQVVTMHNQRDFIFFRHHRYIFEERGEGKAKRVVARLQELGPRFTLRLKSLQMGTFDTQHGEYEWKHKPELDTSRRRFHV